MKVTSETLPERQVRLQIEVDDERHNQAIETAYKKLAPSVRVPGFRPGKAPRTMIEKQLGRHRLLDEAMDLLLPNVYREAIEEQSLDPVASPSVELVSHEPLVFAATVPLMPVIELGDYKSLRVPKETAEVTEKQVDEALTDLQRRYGTIEPVNRAAKKGDIIRGSLSATADDGTLFSQDDLEFRLEEEGLSSLPGLYEAIAGLKKGADIETKTEVRKDFADERVAGKTVTYKVKVDEVKEEKPAKADDAFAKEVGEGFDSLKALRDRLREDLVKATQDAADHNYEHAVIDALTAGATIEFPAVLVEREIDHILEEQTQLDPRDPRAVELYLARLGKEEAEVRDSVREEAIERLRRSLVLSEFAEAENIVVEDADVDAELQTLVASAGEQADAILQLLGSESSRESIKRSLHTRKTLGRLTEIASSSDGASAAKKPAKARRSTPRKAADKDQEKE
ncbi:MAG TPA: trigger factor [Dehalococcoidia bacterium]|nr:trigger factor [Dehalococcoidia bacterium]